jgi:chromosome partitioning protein
MQGDAKDTLILAVANQKGGVGKTTTAVNLGASLALLGQEVLLIDLDPQGNASTGLGIARSDRRVGSHGLLMNGGAPDDAIFATPIPHLSLIPAEQALSGAELDLMNQPQGEFLLRKSLAGWKHERRFRFILIDCPPSLGFLTLNGLIAASEVLIPLQCEFYALEGVTALMRTIEIVRRRFNPEIKLCGVLLTMFDMRNKLSSTVATEARAYFGDWVYETVIPRNVRLSESASFGQPAILYDPQSTGAKSYSALALEVVQKYDNRQKRDSQ